MIFQKKQEIREHNGAVYSIDGTSFFVFTSAADKFVVKWNIQEAQQEKFAIKMDHTSYKLVLHDQKLFIGSNKGELYVIDTVNRVVEQQRKITDTAIYSLILKDELIIIGTADGTIHFLEKDSLQENKQLSFSCGKIRDLIFLNSQMLALACQDGFIRIINTETFELEHRFFAHEKGVNKLLQIDHKLFSAGKDAHLKVWDWQSEELLSSWPLHYEAIYDMKQIGDKLITASRDKSIKIWELDDSQIRLLQKITAKEKGHSHSVNALYIIDEFNFCSVGDDRRIIWWSCA